MNRLVAVSRAALVALAATACASEEIRMTLEGKTQRGDTIVIASSGDGVWGPPHDAVEVLRVSATSKETTFGQIRALTATPDGGVIVFDAKGAEGKIIRQFDSTGKFVRNIGREGGGPGEYSTTNAKIVVSPRGEILVRDEMRSVIRYSSDGRFLGGFQLERGGGWFGLVAADDGSLYLPAVYTYGNRMPPGDRKPILKRDSTGRVLDTIAPGRAWLSGSESTPDGHPRYHSPSEQWIMLSDGRAVIGRTDKLGFLLINPSDERASPLLAEHAYTPTPFLEDERNELQANSDAGQRGHSVGGERMPGTAPMTVPSHKLAFTTLDADADGRIWLRLRTVSEKIPPLCVAFGLSERGPSQCLARVTYQEPPVHAAFDLNGTYLGEVRFSIKASFMSFAGQYAWAVTRDEDDVQILTKYRLYQ